MNIKPQRFKVKKRSLFGVLFSKEGGGIPYKTYWAIISLSRNNKLLRLLIDITALFFYKTFRSSKTFLLNGQRYKYFYHLYNRTVASERVVEIPVAKRLLDKYQSESVLEVGNVLPHYFPVRHDVLDKYEKTRRVINKDVVSYKPTKKYNLILSISTMEHVGYSYGEPLKPNKFSQGIRNLKKNLEKDGLLFVTFSLYYNDYISDLIRSRKSPFTEEYFMKRTSFWNEWKQISRKEAMKKEGYDAYYANANILYLGIFKKSKLTPKN